MERVNSIQVNSSLQYIKIRGELHFIKFFIVCVSFHPLRGRRKNERRSNVPCMPCVVQITNLALHIQLIIDVLRPDETTLMNCNEEMLYLRKVFVCYEY